MSEYWLAQTLNALVLVTFGAALVWRSRVQVQKRQSALSFPPTAATDKEVQIARIRAEIMRLQSRLAELEAQPSTVA